MKALRDRTKAFLRGRRAYILTNKRKLTMASIFPKLTSFGEFDHKKRIDTDPEEFLMMEYLPNVLMGMIRGLNGAILYQLDDKTRDLIYSHIFDIAHRDLLEEFIARRDEIGKATYAAVEGAVNEFLGRRK